MRGRSPSTSRKPKKRRWKKRKHPGSNNTSPTYWGVKHASKALEDLAPDDQITCWFHFPSFCFHFLKIWTKPDDDGERHLVPLEWNYAQREFWPKLARRTYFLKSRQVGWTTICQAYDFWVAVTKPAAVVQMLTHNMELQETMRTRIQVFLEALPERFKVEVLMDNRTGFKFGAVPGIGLDLAKSELKIMTVSGKQKGIGKTINVMHLTELSRWEDLPGGLSGYLKTAMQAVPKSGTIMIETTPNGIGHPSYQLWKESRSRTNKFDAIFMPWWFDDTARLDAPDDFAPANDAERKLLSQGATPEHIMFRRWKVVELNSADCDGETMFNQEYPSDPRSCFLSGGKMAFSGQRLQEQEKFVDIERQAWKLDGSRWPRYGTVCFGAGGGPMFSEGAEGSPLIVWEPPRKGVQYVIGADAGKGLETGDPSAACIIRADTMEQVAEYRATCLPQTFSEHLGLMGRMYNDALVAPETNDQGPTVIVGLVEQNYPNIFRKQRNTKGWMEDNPYGYGWHNNASTRPMAIDQARLLIWERNVRIRSKALIEELLSFIADSKGKYQAPRNGHDDLAWAFIIAVWAINHGIYQPDQPWVPGDDGSEMETTRNFNERLHSGVDVWEEELDQAVQVFLR